MNTNPEQPPQPQENNDQTTETWSPPAGRLAKAFAVVMLAIIAIVLLIMIASLFFNTSN
ncbi:hypothetical protein [Poriferisphaera sp. WC338]|uniref:hypothetical protein n=1 Tax=Poriferisphaera sp. WC338 TaxID=3425129 RepID=UPI003D81B9AA